MSSHNVPSVTLRTGALAPRICEQVEQQGLKIATSEVMLLQRAADAITYLSVHSFLTEGQRNAANKKLAKQLARAVTRE